MFNKKYKKRIVELEKIVAALDVYFLQQVTKLYIRGDQQREDTKICPRCGEESYLNVKDRGIDIYRCVTCNYSIRNTPSYDGAINPNRPKSKARHRK